MTHTLFTEWKTGFNTFDNSFPFSRLKTEDFEPALIATFNQAKQNIVQYNIYNIISCENSVPHDYNGRKQP